MLEQYLISDLLTWIDERTLVLNPEFQRRSVWPPQAKTYLIDTILRGRPMPNIYMRIKTDLATRRAYRDVVDGQQRLRAIHEFANGQFALGKGTGDLSGLRYEDLDEETKTQFLTYSIGVVQLSNANDSEVLDVFHRINAYGLSLNKQELRHGKYRGAFRNAVVERSRRWDILWSKHRVVGIRDRVRMADDELTAQMLGVVLEGVKDGGQPTIDRLYKEYDKEIPQKSIKKLDATVECILTDLCIVTETPFIRGAHFLMLFAAVSHAIHGIPCGDIDPDKMPDRSKDALSDMQTAHANLGMLADVIAMDESEIASRFLEFKRASAETTQRIRSRAPRFLWLYKALLPELI